jgi:hypothetical protein
VRHELTPLQFEMHSLTPLIIGQVAKRVHIDVQHAVRECVAQQLLFVIMYTLFKQGVQSSRSIQAGD